MDEIIGIAVLTRSVPTELLIVCRKANGNIFHGKLPVYKAGEAKPADQAWQYQAVGDTLNCQPSVHYRYQVLPDETWHTRFHNGFSWSVKYKLADGAGPDEAMTEFVKLNESFEDSHRL
jgi:hypothetical protein